MKLALGGSPAITAHNLAMLGSRVGFISLAADDAFAKLCMGELQEANVDLSRVVRAPAGTSTGVSVVLLHERRRRILTYAGTTALLRMEHLDLAYIAAARHFHLSSYFLQQGLRGDVPALLDFCRQSGVSVSLDPNDDPSGDWTSDVLDLLAYVDILMPNEREACRMVHEEDAERAFAKLRERVPTLVVKQGRLGAVAYRDGKKFSAPAVGEFEPVDAVGAGDSFNAGFLQGFLAGLEIEECLQLGNLAGAFSTTAVGGTQAFRDRSALTSFMAMHGLPSVNARR